MRINSLDPTLSVSSRTLITATKRDKEVVLNVPRPQMLLQGEFRRMDMMTIAGKKLSIIVLGPRGVIHLEKDNGVKVIYGMYIMLLRIAAKKLIFLHRLHRV